MDALPPEDRAPGPSNRRMVPPGLLAAAVLATVVVVVAVFVAVRSGPESTAASPTSGSGTAPVFTIRTGLAKNSTEAIGKPLPDLAYTSMDEQPLTSAKYKGKPLVINFWSSTCTPCITEMPDIQKVHGQLGDKVAFLGLDVQDAIESGKFMLEKTGAKYDVGRDPRGDVLTQLGGINLPTTVFVAADGTVKAIHTGQLSADELRQVIDRELLS